MSQYVCVAAQTTSKTAKLENIGGDTITSTCVLLPDAYVELCVYVLHCAACLLLGSRYKCRDRRLFGALCDATVPTTNSPTLPELSSLPYTHHILMISYMLCVCCAAPPTILVKSDRANIIHNNALHICFSFFFSPHILVSLLWMQCVCVCSMCILLLGAPEWMRLVLVHHRITKRAEADRAIVVFYKYYLCIYYRCIYICDVFARCVARTVYIW